VTWISRGCGFVAPRRKILRLVGVRKSNQVMKKRRCMKRDYVPRNMRQRADAMSRKTEG